MNDMLHENISAKESLSDSGGRNFCQTDKTLGFCRKLLQIIFKDYSGPVAIQLWNGETVIGNDHAQCLFVIRRPCLLRDLLSSSNLNNLAEGYLNGDTYVEGDLETCFDLIDFIQGRNFRLSEFLKIFLLSLKISGSKKKVHPCPDTGTFRDNNSKFSIAHHYDVSNEFYKLFLDPEMVYSCAYFSGVEQSLVDAQQDKLDYICRKLRLAPGQKLLDIGCGWGGLAIWAAKNYGVDVHGITLSQEQYSYAVARARDLKLDNKINFELRDYRELSGDTKYDRIVSVGMFEHIGIDNFPLYFSTVRKLLKPEGLFLNHGITNDTGWRNTPITQFINNYIFPDGELARISDVINAMEKEGFEILDTEALRPHYVLTLRNWVRELEKKSYKAVKIAGERIYKLWRLYMAGSAYYFDQGSTGVYQVLACKQHHPWFLPLRRDDLYND